MEKGQPYISMERTPFNCILMMKRAFTSFLRLIIFFPMGYLFDLILLPFFFPFYLLRLDSGWIYTKKVFAPFCSQMGSEFDFVHGA